MLNKDFDLGIENTDFSDYKASLNVENMKFYIMPKIY